MNPYVYAVLWLLVGLILLIRFGRENKIFYLLGGFFLVLGIWWGADAYTGAGLFEGVWGWVLRGLTAAVLVIACVAYYRETKKNRAAFEAEKKEQAAARKAALEGSALPEETENGEDGGDADDAPQGGTAGSDEDAGGEETAGESETPAAPKDPPRRRS